VLWSRNAEALHAVCYGDELVQTAPGETVYTCLPLFHVTAQGTLLGTLLRGGRTVVDRRFDPLRFWARTRAVDAVFFPYVGTIISTLLSRPARRRDSDNPVRRAMGSATPAGLWEAFERRFDVVLEDVWGRPRRRRAGPTRALPDRYRGASASRAIASMPGSLGQGASRLCSASPANSGSARTNRT
jgi:acyl-CoA synthetase (AMP-forming)/AMP-acid ligase II